MSVCSELSTIVFPVVCNSSPEGFLPSCEVQPVEKEEELEVRKCEMISRLLVNNFSLYRVVEVSTVMPSHCCCAVGTAVRSWWQW